MAYKHNPNHKIQPEQLSTQNKATYVEHDPIAERGKPYSEMKGHLTPEQVGHVRGSKNLSGTTQESLTPEVNRKSAKERIDSDKIFLKSDQESYNYYDKLSKKKIKSGLGNKK